MTLAPIWSLNQESTELDLLIGFELNILRFAGAFRWNTWNTLG
jgi:hypothetical protein